MSDRNQALQYSWVVNAEAWTQAVREELIESRKVSTNASIRDAIAAHPKGRVLDVGCGEGWLARELADLGFEVTGVDGSAPLIEAAQRGGGANYFTLTYEDLIADPTTLGAPFEYIVCNFSLLGEDLGALLAALRANLKPGGLLFLQTLHPHVVAGTEPYRDGWRVETFAGMGSGFRAPMPWYFRTVASWFGELRRAGFNLVGLEEPVHPETGRALSLLLTAR